MKKILLIEDRTIRQKFFINETRIKLDSYSNILDNFIDEEYNEFELQLKNDSFDFKKYDYIISHKSAFGEVNSELLSKLSAVCEHKKIPLILFSGGISTNYYSKSKCEILELNSKTFYSQNLELFLKSCENGNENILMLCYGKQWQQNIVSNILEKTNIYLDTNSQDDVEYLEFSNFVDMENLSSISFDFHPFNIENGWIYLDEIKKFRDSLYSFFTNRNKRLLNENGNHTDILIHNNNIVDLQQFNSRIKFTPNTSDIDAYISKNIIIELKNKEYDVVYIKDNLSDNYLELYGIRVAYHIRLSKELGDKNKCPIVILSDFNRDMLNQLDPMARILFTNNIFIVSNTKEEVDKLKKKTFNKLSEEEYQNNFLNLITVEPSKDYTDHHDITNEWAIYQWSNALDLTTAATDINHNKISSMLYFKYLKTLHADRDTGEQKYTIKSSSKKGKILYIDDEWNRGWSDILQTLFKQSPNIEFQTFEYEYKDANKFVMIGDIKSKVETENPDIVLLDLRLLQSDHHKKEDIEQYAGIEILKKIQEINPGIQVIMMTATRQSIILEKLYDYGVLGYIKKEHPDDISVSTIENIDKLFTMVESGLERKYLKDIYLTKSKILTILENDIFEKYKITIELYEPFWIQIQVEINQVFDILSSTTSQNKFKYAMVSIASSLEAILSIFIREKRGSDNIYWDGEICKANTLNTKLNDLFYDKFGYEIKDQYRSKLKFGGMIAKRNDYLHSRSEFDISKDEIKSWFNKFLKMIEIIQNPPSLHIYNTENLVENLSNAFNDR